MANRDRNSTVRSRKVSGSIPRGQRQQRAYETLKEMIILQELKPKELVSEVGLAERIGVGRANVRAALQRLQGDGLVEIYAQRGCLITEIDISTQLKVLEVRAELERLMAKNAAKKMSSRLAKPLGEAADAMRAAAAKNDARSFMASLRTLHDLMAEAADNEVLSRSITHVQVLSRRFWYAHYERHADMREVAELHCARVDAILNRDPEAAGGASDRLVAYLEDFTRSTVFGSDAGSSRRSA